MMQRIVAVLGAATLITLMGGATASATGQGEHVPVNVCHATSSDTNPYVFITVDDDSTKLQGHLMHRDDPNKTWKSDGVWDGVPHQAGDLKADRIETYTDSDGVLHELDGTFDDCGTGVVDEPTTVSVDFIDPTCDTDAAIITDYDPAEATVTVDGKAAPGETVTVTFTALDGYVIEGTTVFEHTFGPPVVGCNPPEEVTPAEPGFTDPTCDAPAGLNLPDSDVVAYGVVGEIAPGSTVTVTATVQDGVKDTILVGKTTWTHTYGDKPVNCGNPPNPTPNPPECTNPTECLPSTGANESTPWLAGVGILLTVAGAAIKFSTI